MARSTPISRHVGRLSRSQVAAKRGLFKGVFAPFGGLEGRGVMGMERAGVGGDGERKWGDGERVGVVRAERGAGVCSLRSWCDAGTKSSSHKSDGDRDSERQPARALSQCSRSQCSRCAPTPVRSRYPDIAPSHAQPAHLPNKHPQHTLTRRQEDRRRPQEGGGPRYCREDRRWQGQRREARHPHQQGVQVLPRRGRPHPQEGSQARCQGRSPLLDHPRHRPHPPCRPLLGPPRCFP